MCGLDLTILRGDFNDEDICDSHPSTPSFHTPPLSALSDTSSWTQSPLPILSTETATRMNVTLTSHVNVPIWLQRRGPDHFGCIQVVDVGEDSTSRPAANTNTTGTCDDNDGDHSRQSTGMFHITFQASVLQMRKTLTTQPVSIPGRKGTMCYLAWNGEIYQQWDVVEGRWHDTWSYQQSDTLSVAKQLQSILSTAFVKEVLVEGVDNSDGDQERHHKIAAFLATLSNAEYAFVLLTDDAVYYARDPIGRRSLVVYSNREEIDTPDTTTGRTPNVATDTINAQKGFERRTAPLRSPTCKRTCIWKIASVITNTPRNDHVQFYDGDGVRADTDNFVGCCGWSEVPPGKLFCYRWRSNETTSIGFNAVQSPQMGLTLSSDYRLHATRPAQTSPLIRVKSMEEASIQLQTILSEAVRRRLGAPVPPIIATMEKRYSPDATTVKTHDAGSSLYQNQSCAILFSGGLDSAVLAALALQLLPNDAIVLLLNISFRDQAEHDFDKKHDHPRRAADTHTALQSYRELKRSFPFHSNVRLILKEATWKDIEAVESWLYDTLIPPKRSTVMDINIATAMWFATAACDDETRIVLTGLGADELMGGYGRHRQAWLKQFSSHFDPPTSHHQRRGNEDKPLSDIKTPEAIHENTHRNQALRAELDKDWERLWERNLGRDDRVISDHGKEARYPYLDVHVVEFLRDHVPIDFLCDFTLPQGEGDKRILRRIANRFGLPTASGAVKRAIQFGSRVAQISDTNRFGSRRKATGTRTANRCKK